MLKKEDEIIKEIKQKVSDFSGDAVGVACDINNLCVMLSDYCAYNTNSETSRIITLAEVLKEKTDILIDTIDLGSIDVANL